MSLDLLSQCRDYHRLRAEWANVTGMKANYQRAWPEGLFLVV